MKRLVLILLAIVMVIGLSSCKLTQLSDTEGYVLKKLARTSGMYIALEKPEDVQEAIAYCEHIKSLKTGVLKEAALKTAMKYIQKRYGNTFKAVLLMGEVTDLIKFAVPDETGLTIDIKLLNMAVESFQEGLEIVPVTE